MVTTGIDAAINDVKKRYLEYNNNTNNNWNAIERQLRYTLKQKKGTAKQKSNSLLAAFPRYSKRKPKAFSLNNVINKINSTLENKEPNNSALTNRVIEQGVKFSNLIIPQNNPSKFTSPFPNLNTNNNKRLEFIKRVTKSDEFTSSKNIRNTKLSKNNKGQIETLVVNKDFSILDFVIWIWMDVKHDRGSGRGDGTFRDSEEFKNGGLLFFLYMLHPEKGINEWSKEIKTWSSTQNKINQSFFLSTKLCGKGVSIYNNKKINNIFWVGGAVSKTEELIEDKFVTWYDDHKTPDIVVEDPISLGEIADKFCPPNNKADLIPLSLDQTQGPLYTLNTDVFESHISIAALADKGYPLRANKGVARAIKGTSYKKIPTTIKYNTNALQFDIKSNNTTLLKGYFDVHDLKGKVTLTDSIFGVTGTAEILSAKSALNDSSSLAKFFGDYIPMLYTLAYKSTDKVNCSIYTNKNSKNLCNRRGGDMMYATGDRMAAMIYEWSTIGFEMKPLLAWDKKGTDIQYVYSIYTPGHYQFCTESSNTLVRQKTRAATLTSTRGTVTSKKPQCIKNTEIWYKKGTNKDLQHILNGLTSINAIREHAAQCNHTTRLPALLNLLTRASNPNSDLTISWELKNDLAKLSTEGILNRTRNNQISNILIIIKKRYKHKLSSTSTSTRLATKTKELTKYVKDLPPEQISIVWNYIKGATSYLTGRK